MRRQKTTARVGAERHRADGVRRPTRRMGLHDRRAPARFLSHRPLSSGFVCDTQRRFFVPAPVTAPLPSKSATKKTLHGVPRWLPHFCPCVTVGLEGKRHAGVTGHLAHFEWLATLEQQHGRRSAPKIMWADVDISGLPPSAINAEMNLTDLQRERDLEEPG
jgi:hypothetical protein